MKILITGSRTYWNWKKIYEELKDYPKDTTIIHGAARGADTLAGEVASQLGFKVIEVPAQWNKYGKSAGPIRNNKMLDMNPDLVIAFPLPGSKGTKHCMEEAEKRGIPLKVVTCEDSNEKQSS